MTHGYTVTVSPAFWDDPDWFEDGRDNPRDPRHEPFWCRPARLRREMSEEAFERVMTHFQQRRAIAEIYRKAGMTMIPKINDDPNDYAYTYEICELGRTVEIDYYRKTVKISKPINDDMSDFFA